MLRVTLVAPRGAWPRRSQIVLLSGCALFALACGGRADSTTLESSCDDGMVCSRGEIDPEQQGDGTAPAGESQPDATMNASNQDPRSSEPVETCSGAMEVSRAYFRETQPGPSMPSFDEEGQLIVPEVVIGPCSQCISTCSPEPRRGCGLQDSCVQRHCDCGATGCENGIPTGDFCLCAATCMGPGQAVCLESWVPYGQCLAGCASACAQGGSR